MNVNIINERFPEYQNMSQQEFDNLTDQYKQKYAPLSEKEKKLLGRYYTDTMKSIYTPRKMTSFDTLESYLEKSNLESITNDNLINIPYNVFVQLEERYEQEKKKGKTANFEKIQIYLHRYIKDLKKASKGFTLLYDKKLNNMNAYDTIEYIETIIQNPKFSAEHPSYIDIYLVYNPGSKPFHATCIFEFESFYYEFSHYGGGSNVGSIMFETYPEKGNNIYEYGRGDSVLATKICDEAIPQNIANNITLQTLLNISMFWWSKTDACNIRTFPGSCTGLVETATILTNLNNVCNNVAVNKSVILMGFKRKKSRLSSKRRSPHKSSRRSPRKSSRRRSPRKSTRRRSTSKSSKRRNPRKSTRRSPRKSPKRRSPRKSSKRRSPRKSSKRRSPRN